MDAADFDKDVDLDIGTIAFFTDFRNILAENDYDDDGDLDIIMGNIAKILLILKDYTTDWDLNTPFVVLENVSVVSGH